MKKIFLIVLLLYCSISIVGQSYISDDGTSAPKWRIGNDRFIELYSDNDSNFVQVNINGFETRLATQDWILSKTRADSVKHSYNLLGGSSNRIAYQVTADSTNFIIAPTAQKFLYYDGMTWQWKWAWSPDTTTVVRTWNIASADGLTKGIAAFNYSDFNSSAGVISIDYTNAQKANSSQHGFLTSTDWTTFNNKENVLTFYSPLSRSVNTISLLYDALNFSVVGNHLTANNITASSSNGMSITSPFTLGSSITINTPQDIRQSATPTFSGLTLNGTLFSYGNINQTGSYSIYNNFISGWTGSGYRLDYGITEAGKSYLEIDNLTVRKRMSIYELLIRQIQAVNGNLFVSSSAKAVSASSAQITFEDPTGHNVLPFIAGDLLVVQRLKLNGDQVNKLVYGEFTVTSVSGMIVNGSWNTAPVSYSDVKGCELVRVGNTSDATRRASIYLASDDSYSPYIDIIDGVNSWAAWSSSSKTKSRFGKLDGIYDADFGGYLSGYGGYIQNLFAKGVFRITNPSTFNNGSPLNTSDLSNNSGWDNTTDGLNSGVTITGGGIVLNTNAVIRSGQTAYQTGTGYWIGVSSGMPRFSLGNASTKYIAWDGSNLNIRGNVYMDGGSITWSAVNEPTRSDLGTWTTYITDSGIYTGTLTADQVNAVNVIADSVMANHYIYSPHLVGGDIAIGSGNSIFKADANGIYLGNSSFASAPFRVNPSGFASMTSANIANWSITSDKIEKVTYDGSKWLYVDLYSTFSNYTSGLVVKAEHNSATKVLVTAGAYNDGNAARYGFSIWDAINSQWLMNIGYGGTSNNFTAQISGFNFDYNKFYSGTSTAGISLNKSSTPFITGTSAKGFEVYDVSDPKMFIGKKDGDYLDWNVTTANVLTIAGKIKSSRFSTTSAFGGNYDFAVIDSDVNGSLITVQNYTDADNASSVTIQPNGTTDLMNFYHRIAGSTQTININYYNSKLGISINGSYATRYRGSGVSTSRPTSDLRDGDMYWNTTFSHLDIYAYGAWR